jgi:hypothetical protein
VLLLYISKHSLENGYGGGGAGANGNGTNDAYSEDGGSILDIGGD